MLKITITETQTGSRWVLQGRLAGPWVGELRKCWKTEQRAKSWTRCVVDLNDVTCIDKAGERLLRALSKKGVELVASGMYTKHLIEKLRMTDSVAFRNMIVSLFAALLFTGIFSSDCVWAGAALKSTSAPHRLAASVNQSYLSDGNESDLSNGHGGTLCSQNS